MSTGGDQEAGITAYATEQLRQAVPSGGDGHLLIEPDFRPQQRSGHRTGLSGCDGEGFAEAVWAIQSHRGDLSQAQKMSRSARLLLSGMMVERNDHGLIEHVISLSSLKQQNFMRVLVRGCGDTF